MGKIANYVSISVIICLLVMLGFFCGAHFSTPPSPIITESTTIHYCLCISDQPEYQSAILDASNNIDDLIQEKNEEFNTKHGLRNGDFSACFIPRGNGSYSIRIWCSNRDCGVADLLSEYRSHIDSLLAPHRKIMKEAHASHSKSE